MCLLAKHKKDHKKQYVAKTTSTKLRKAGEILNFLFEFFVEAG